MVQGALVDGDPKKPTTDFFLDLGIVIPTIAIVGVCVMRLWMATGQRTPCPLRPAYMGALLIGVMVIGVVLCGWVHDDVINRDVPYGAVPHTFVPAAPLVTTRPTRAA